MFLTSAVASSGAPVNLPFSIRCNVYLTASEVSGVPSWNSMPGFSSIVHVIASLLAVSDFARSYSI